MDYIPKYNILSPSQYGFRPNYSTELALYYFCSKIHRTLDDKESKIAVFCDLSKAFDTISHPILMKKLRVYGICGIIFK